MSRVYDTRPIYYVYTHDNTRPERGELGCRWIGKGKEERAWKIGRNIHWNRIFSVEFPPDVQLVAENLTEEEAFEIEKWLIAVAKTAGIKLCNLTDGGEGPSGRIASEESRKRMSVSAKRVGQSETVKKKRSEAQKLSYQSPEKRRKTAEWMRSETIRKACHSPSVNEKRSKTLAATNQRPDIKEKQSNIQKSIWARPGMKKKRSEAQSRAWADPEKKAARLEAIRLKRASSRKTEQ